MQRHVFVLTLVICSLSFSARAAAPSTWTNSIGMEFTPVAPGTFLMGGEDADSDGDEQPVHEVTIAQPFAIGVSEVTVEQFRQFRPGSSPDRPGDASMTGVNWYEAVAFCEWLSAKEDKPYRLPTEAEWEYACRAASRAPFATGSVRPVPGTANAWGVKNMHTGAREWCLDWYGPYDGLSATGPIGPNGGWGRVVRGGGLDNDDARFARSANRASMVPSFGAPPPKDGVTYATGMGHHDIGFRVVQAPAPATPPTPRAVPFVQQCVKQETSGPTQGPDPARPYYHMRAILPVPPENTPAAAIAAAGLGPALRGHNHSPSIEVMPNGDLLALYFSSETHDEYTPDVALLGTRLRRGADEWDMPEVLLDLADVNDGPSLLWNDGGTVWLFWGPTRLMDSYPFLVSTTNDSGASFKEARCAVVEGDAGPHWRQPINTALRDASGTLYVPTDGDGGTSVLWATRNNGTTWFDTAGRTGGRHTTFALLDDGAILGMGGKTTAIDGFMPKSISRDGGKTWAVSKTPFAALGSNQRPCVLKLASGRLFFCGDFQHYDGRQPADVTEHGAYAALSEDNGETWRIKRLPDARPHEARIHDWPTIGYSVARQAPNGVIHLITSMNHPSLHFELNEAWILSDDDTAQERSWLLNGVEKFAYPNGAKQYEAAYAQGRKTGTETYWREDGGVHWQRVYTPEGRCTWTQFWPNGQKKTESIWIGGRCEGKAQRWSADGATIASARFLGGQAVEW